MRIRCLSLRQPWATLMSISAKKIETRSWQTSYRGLIAIHAAKGFSREARDLCWQQPFYDALKAVGLDERHLPLGRIVGIGRLLNVAPTHKIREIHWLLSAEELAFGDYHDGRFAWHFGATVKQLPEPVTAPGKLGLWWWEVPEQLEPLCETASGAQ